MKAMQSLYVSFFFSFTFIRSMFLTACLISQGKMQDVSLETK